MANGSPGSANTTKVEMEDNKGSARVLSVTEAAAHFGISTLRVRHRLRTGQLRGFRDNRGHWQVRLDDDIPAAAEDRPLDGQALTDMLTEELIEALDRIEDQETIIARLRVVVERQQKLLERLISRLEATPAPQAAASAPELSDRIRDTLDRLLALLETSLQQHAAANARAERFRAMMARAIELLEGIEPSVRAAARTGKLDADLTQAIDLGDRAIKHAELTTHHAVQLDTMLDRALAVAERNVESHRLTEQKLKSRDDLLVRSFKLIEAASTQLRGNRGKARRWLAFFSRREP